MSKEAKKEKNSKYTKESFGITREFQQRNLL